MISYTFLLENPIVLWFVGNKNQSSFYHLHSPASDDRLVGQFFYSYCPLSLLPLFSCDHLSKWFIIEQSGLDSNRNWIQWWLQVSPAEDHTYRGSPWATQTICHKARIVLRLMVPIKTIIIPILLILAHPLQTIWSFVKPTFGRVIGKLNSLLTIKTGSGKGFPIGIVNLFTDGC